MSKIKDAFDGVRALALSSQTAYTKIVVGSLPAADGMCMEIASGYEESADLGFASRMRVVCVMNCKSESQETALSTLCTVHEALGKTREYPYGTGWQVSSIKSIGVPSYLGMDGDQYLYGSSIEIMVECD